MSSPYRQTNINTPRTTSGEDDGNDDGLQVGSPVWVRRKQGQPLAQGMVKYMGFVDFADGDDWVGVQLTGSSVGQGKNDGSVAGKVYFESSPQHPKSGLFVRKSCVTPRPKNNNNNNNNTPPLSSPPLSSPRRSKRSRTQNINFAMTPPKVPRSPPKTTSHNKSNHRRNSRGVTATPPSNYRDAQEERYEALLRWKQAKREGRHSSSNYELSSSITSTKSLVGWTISVGRSQSAGRPSRQHYYSGGAGMDNSLNTVPQRDRRYRRHYSSPCLQQYQSEVEDENVCMASNDGASTISSFTGKWSHYEDDDEYGDDHNNDYNNNNDEHYFHQESDQHVEAEDVVFPEELPKHIVQSPEAENVPPSPAITTTTTMTPTRFEKAAKGRKRRYAGMLKEPTGKATMLRERLRSLEKWRLENGRRISDDEAESGRL